MRVARAALFAACLAGFAGSIGPARAENWPAWRGADASGISRETGLPTEWGPDRNVKWKADLAGEGSSTPIIWEDRIFLTSQKGAALAARLGGGAGRRGLRQAAAEPASEPQSPPQKPAPAPEAAETVLFIECFNRNDGSLMWRREIKPSVLFQPNRQHNMASPSCVTDGQHVWSLFGTGDLLCHDLDGKEIWRRTLGVDYGPFNILHGYGSSPVLYKDLLIVIFGHDPKGAQWTPPDAAQGKPHAFYVLALDKASGQQRYELSRPLEEEARNSFTTPLIVQTAERDELIVPAQMQVYAYDPASGKDLWTCSGPGDQVVASPCYVDGLIYVPSGQTGPMIAVRPGGQGDVTQTHVVWSQPEGRPRVASALVYDGRVYIADEKGVATCLDAKTGAMIWRNRLEGAHFASPLGAEGHIYYQTLEGDGYVLKSGPQFELLGKNSMNERCVASYAVSHACIFLRSSARLYCIAKTE